MEIAIIGSGMTRTPSPPCGLTRLPGRRRTAPADFINIPVEEPTGDRPFDNLDDFNRREELRALSDRYKRIAGYSIEDLAAGSAAAAG
ncbi:MAG TPA: hypothetical protein VGQ90_11135 [Stellaceae bacterium]|jgi:hypothetical protein|nr:hypothetical protein [Stellaceae bacterium]